MIRTWALFVLGVLVPRHQPVEGGRSPSQGAGGDLPWEGFTDVYSDLTYPGGVREDGFVPLWANVTEGATPDRSPVAHSYASSNRRGQMGHTAGQCGSG